ncbi:MAG: site-2 protease family protein [Neisseria sp.]|nr:site-2 protease family protein [Neisseria sp.]
MFQKFDLGVFLLAVLPVLLAITIREAARAYAARRYGDPTPEQFGRLTLNPLVHIDLFGTIIVPLLMFLFTPFVFGWAKPVPIDSRRFSHPRQAWRAISAVGPLANLSMAFVWGLGFVLAPHVGSFGEPLSQMSNYGVMINAVLFVLNIIPILPFDGGRFIDTFLPAKASMSFQKIEPYGSWIVLLLLITGVLGKFISPLVFAVMLAVQSLANLLM